MTVDRVRPGTLKPLSVSRGLKSARLKIAVAAVVLAAAMSACGGDKIEYADADVGTLYNKAHEFMAGGQYRFAAVMFDEVERQHPYSVWARRATLMSAYNHYLSNDYDSSILAAQRFLALHPGNRDAPYAYYLIAISYYEQISDVGRDQKATQQALDALNEVIRRFPGTDYAEDARLKVELTRDHLAGKEMTIGRFYMGQKEYIAGISRFRKVIKDFQTTSQTPEALHRLVECYLAIGLNLEAQKAAAVLGYNFPDTNWFKYSYALLEGKGLEPLDLPEGQGPDGEAKNFFDWLF